MKILSKYKDYYDYLSGVYGEDPLLILDRRDGKVVKEHLGAEKITLHIGGYKIDGYKPNQNSTHYKKDKIYWGEELKSIDDYNNLEETYWQARAKYRKEPGRKYYHSKHSIDWALKIEGINKDDIVFIDLNRRDNDCMFFYKLMPDPHNLNKKHDCPIIYKSNTSKEIIFPSLLELGINTVISPEECYDLVSKWLSAKKTEAENHPENLTDKQKIENKGFDTKTSFRPNMK